MRTLVRSGMGVGPWERVHDPDTLYSESGFSGESDCGQWLWWS